MVDIDDSTGTQIMKITGFRENTLEHSAHSHFFSRILMSRDKVNCGAQKSRKYTLSVDARKMLSLIQATQKVCRKLKVHKRTMQITKLNRITRPNVE